MAKTAMHLEQSVLPRVPYRQWVVSFPKRVRYFLHRDPQRFRAVLRSCMRAIESTVRPGCPQAPRTARVAAVLFGQGFGSSLNVHPHGHFVVSEGVYALDDEGCLTFYDRVDALDAAAIAQLTETLRRRVLRHLVRADCLDAGDAADMLGWDHHGGFSLDCSVSLADWDRAALARICRYCARHPFAKGRLQRAGPQRVLYQLPKPDVHGNTQIVLDPLELLDRLAQLIVAPRRHRHTYFGALAPHSALRPWVVLDAGAHERDDEHPAAGAADPEPVAVALAGATDGASATAADATDTRRPLVSLWAIMLAKVYEVLPILCRHCGAEMRPVAVIVDPHSLDRICQHQGQPAGIPKLAPARGPPQADFAFD